MPDRDAAGITRNGLRVDPAKHRAWQQRSRDRARERANRNRARLTTSIGKPRRPKDWPRSVRQLAKQRSGGICEICQAHAATQLHHRKKRRHGDHTIENALHLCLYCHGQIHDDEAGAKLCGWIVLSVADPAVVKVRRKHQLIYLNRDGTVGAA